MMKTIVRVEEEEEEEMEGEPQALQDIKHLTPKMVAAAKG